MIGSRLVSTKKADLRRPFFQLSFLNEADNDTKIVGVFLIRGRADCITYEPKEIPPA